MSNIDTVKQIVRDVVAAYFGDSHVFFAEVKMAKTVDPYVTIQYMNYKRQFFPTDVVSDEGDVISNRVIGFTAQLDLYTKGRNVATGNMLPVYLNSSMEDMEDFLGYLDSEEVTEVLNNHDVVIAPQSGIRDLSAIVNDSSYQFRASVDLDVKFTNKQSGMYGQNLAAQLPNSSGGGSPDMVTEPLTIEEINIIGGKKE